jgi:hypothetical protein
MRHFKQPVKIETRWGEPAELRWLYTAPSHAWGHDRYNVYVTVYNPDNSVKVSWDFVGIRDGVVNAMLKDEIDFNKTVRTGEVQWKHQTSI